jgi:ABC-type antimicrobial peptide transport system permease subunit
MVLMNGLKLTAIGLLIGLPLSSPIPHLLGRLFQEMFVLHTYAILIGVPIFVALVAIVSTYLPALRASRVDPIRALRYE